MDAPKFHSLDSLCWYGGQGQPTVEFLCLLGSSWNGSYMLVLFLDPSRADSLDSILSHLSESLGLLHCPLYSSSLCPEKLWLHVLGPSRPRYHHPVPFFPLLPLINSFIYSSFVPMCYSSPEHQYFERNTIKTAQDMVSNSEWMIWDKRTSILTFQVSFIGFPFLWTYSNSPASFCRRIFNESGHLRKWIDIVDSRIAREWCSIWKYNLKINI